jgi:hypothetical protein
MVKPDPLHHGARVQCTHSDEWATVGMTGTVAHGWSVSGRVLVNWSDETQSAIHRAWVEPIPHDQTGDAA